MRARPGLTRPGDLLFIGDHAKLVVGAELTREQWEEQYGNARLPVKNEAAWREMFDGDPPPGTLAPTFDEGS